MEGNETQVSAPVQAPVENAVDLSRFSVSEVPVEPVVIPSQVTASSVDQSVYEKLAAAQTEEEKLAILNQNQKQEPEKIGSFKEAILASKSKAYEEVDKAIQELNQFKQQPEPTPEPAKQEEYEFTEEEQEEIIAEYEGMKERITEFEMRERIKDQHIAAMEAKLNELQQENLNYKTGSVTLEDEVEQSFIQAKRAYAKESNDSTKYYFLYSVNRILEPHGITIKGDIDQLFGSRRGINSPNVAPVGGPVKPNIPANLSRLGVR